MHEPKKTSVKRDSTLMRESIAEADQLIKVATENAKMQLEEAFAPQLQSMLAQRIQNEVDGGDDVDEFGDITEPEDESGEGVESPEEDFEGGEESFEGGEDEGFGGEENTEGGEFDDEENIDFGDEDLESEPTEEPTEPTEDDMEMEPEPEEDLEEDSDIQEIINELEAGMDDDDDMSFDDHEPSDEELEDVPDISNLDGNDDDLDDIDEGTPGEFSSSDEEIDIEEILREVDMEDEEEFDPNSVNELRTENAILSKKVKSLAKDLNEHIKVLKYTKAKLNEVNLLNAKLLFTNKLFKKNNLTNNEKMKIIECFDRAKSLNEVKLLFSSLAVTYNAAKKQDVTESKKYSSTNKITSKIAGGASKPMKSTKPTNILKPLTEEVEYDNSADSLYENLIIVENDESRDRIQKLAGIGNKNKNKK